MEVLFGEKTKVIDGRERLINRCKKGVLFSLRLKDNDKRSLCGK